MMDTCCLVDLGFQGPSFTSCNRRHGLARVQERLYHTLANMQWHMLFPETVVKHVPQTHYDHCPVLVQCELPSLVDPAKRPFWFQVMWLSPLGFAELVKDTWRAGQQYVVDKVQDLEESLRVWNCDVFGNIFGRKKSL